MGEGEGVLFRIGVNCRIWTKILTTPAGSCITDSLSHTTYVETNQAASWCLDIHGNMLIYKTETDIITILHF